MTIYDTNVIYTMFSMPLVHQYISIVTVFWANKQTGSICSHTLTETLSKCASRHFQKVFQKRTNSHQAARSSTRGVVVHGNLYYTTIPKHSNGLLYDTKMATSTTKTL
jgi:hypothetical protein